MDELKFNTDTMRQFTTVLVQGRRRPRLPRTSPRRCSRAYQTTSINLVCSPSTAIRRISRSHTFAGPTNPGTTCILWAVVPARLCGMPAIRQRARPAASTDRSVRPQALHDWSYTHFGRREES